MRKVVKQFASEMERVLKDNDCKGGWADCPVEYLESRLVEELGEYFGDKANDAYCSTELVDIANFAMMIWDIKRV